uniref:Uncharacterized protein n=1 Tax=Arundo donax TaxID=35708 RepID=A0A0A9GW36_ARUDO
MGADGRLEIVAEEPASSGAAAAGNHSGCGDTAGVSEHC